MTEEENNSIIVIDGEFLENIQYVEILIAENTEASIFRINKKILDYSR